MSITGLKFYKFAKQLNVVKIMNRIFFLAISIIDYIMHKFT